MATFLSKLFKPKWQSKNLATRLEAVEILDETNDSEQSILILLAKTDPDQKVQSAAIAKLNNSEQLIALHKAANDDHKPMIEQRLYELASAQSLTIFDLILDSKLLTEMIIKSDKPDTFISGLARIEDPEALLNIASSSKTSKIRQAAAELLESEQQLISLAGSAKSKDKTVYQIARSKLTQIKEQSKARQVRQQVIEKLLKSTEEHAATESTQLYQARLTTLIERWDAIQDDANEQQHQRFKTACEQCQSKQQKIIDNKLHAEEQQRRIQVGGDEQAATLLTLSETLARFENEAASTQEVSALDALIKTQETRWLEATRQVQVEKTQNKRYQQLMTDLRRYFAALKLTREQAPKIEAIVTDITQAEKNSEHLGTLTAKLTTILQQIDWPETYKQPALLITARQALGHSADIKQQYVTNTKELQQKIAQQIDQLDQCLEERQVKQSAKIHKQIQHQIGQLGTEQRERFNQALSLRLKQLNEIRDWKGYAANPRQQALCEAMERLSELNMEPRAKADKIKAMQKEWKTLGGAADKALWLQFKTASDKAYEPCLAFFDEQNQLKENNTEKRRTLLSQLETYIENNDWQNADWKAAELINRKARNEWKDAYPVNFKTNKSLQHQFNALLEKLDLLLDQERSKNLALKTDIVNTAKELTSLEDLDQAIKQAKTLQQEWQQIGITDRKQDRALWLSYRQACDQVFARRNQARENRREETESAILAADHFISELENVAESAESSDSETLNSAVSEFRIRYRELPSLPHKKQEARQARFESAMQRLKQASQIQENRLRLKQWQEVRRKSTICRTFYTDSLNNEHIRDDRDAIAQLDQTFASRLDLSDTLESSLKALWISVKAGALKNSLIVSLADAHALCIRCEIAAGLDSPDEDKELRMQLQVSRLSEGISSNAEHKSREEQLNALLLEWYQKVGLNVAEFEPLEQRIERTKEHLLG